MKVQCIWFFKWFSPYFLADYVPIGPRFSNLVLQALLVLLKKVPPHVSIFTRYFFLVLYLWKKNFRNVESNPFFAMYYPILKLDWIYICYVKILRSWKRRENRTGEITSPWLTPRLSEFQLKFKQIWFKFSCIFGTSFVTFLYFVSLFALVNDTGGPENSSYVPDEFTSSVKIL